MAALVIIGDKADKSAKAQCMHCKTMIAVGAARPIFTDCMTD